MAAKTRGGTSTVRGSDIDAGVHLDTDAGPVDVGLAVSDTAVAVLIDAPGLGRPEPLCVYDWAVLHRSLVGRAARRFRCGFNGALAAFTALYPWYRRGDADLGVLAHLQAQAGLRCGGMRVKSIPWSERSVK